MMSLPWRLSYSLARLGDRIEWRPENFWFANGSNPWKEDHHPGNTHVMAIFRREAVAAIGGRYPNGTYFLVLYDILFFGHGICAGG